MLLLKHCIGTPVKKNLEGDMNAYIQALQLEPQQFSWQSHFLRRMKGQMWNGELIGKKFLFKSQDVVIPLFKDQAPSLVTHNNAVQRKASKKPNSLC